MRSVDITIPLLSLVFAIGCTLGANGQITITRSDMPQPGDTLRVSMTTTVPPGYQKSAMDTTWDFSMLEPLAQRLDTFKAATATPAGYQLVFVLLGGANLASPGRGINLPGFPVSQGYTFYRNSEAAFEELGSGYMVQGFPLPARYDVPEKVYQFPVAPGAGWNSHSTFAISLPSLGYYGTARTRSSTVDGWGTLVTPLGTFSTLRIRSVVTLHDSIHMDSLGTGFSLDRNITEYRWLAGGMGIPVLQVNEENGIATALYRDIFRLPAQALSVDLGPDTAVLKGTALTLHAAVSGGVPPYQVLWSTLDTGMVTTLTVTEDQTVTAMVFDAMQNFSGDQVAVTVRFPPGMNESDPEPFRVWPVPACGKAAFSLPATARAARAEVITPEGRIVSRQELRRTGNQFVADLTGIPAGMYLLRVSSGDKHYTAKLAVTN